MVILVTKGGYQRKYIYTKNNGMVSRDCSYTADEQRKVLEPFFVNNVPGVGLIRKCWGIKYVNIDLSQEGNTCRVSTPYAEWEASLTTGGDGKTPQRIENSVFSRAFPVVNICNTHFWKFNDFGRNWDFKNRSGARADFDMKG